MSDRPASPEPERVLVQLLADALRFEYIFPAIKRLEHVQRSSHEMIVRENAAQAGQPFVGMDGDQGVHAIVGFQFVAPASFRGRASQAGIGFRGFSCLGR